MIEAFHGHSSIVTAAKGPNRYDRKGFNKKSTSQSDMPYTSWRRHRYFQIHWLLSVATSNLVTARLQSNNVFQLSRFLDEKGADEDDDSNLAVDTHSQRKPWRYVEHYIAKDSLAYDMVEAFGYVAAAMIAVVVVWTCLEYCGACPDIRLDRRRDLRRVKDGRGVFSPLVDDSSFDDSSEESAEYGHSREKDPFGNVRPAEADNELEKAANRFFSKGEVRQQKKKSSRNKKYLEIELSDEFAVKTVFV